MVNLSRYTLRGVATVGALAGLAAMALPNAQAAQTAGTTGTAATSAAATTANPALPIGGTAYAIGNPPAGEGVSTKSSTLNLVRYNRLYKTGPVTPSKCKEVNVSLRTFSGVKAYDTQLWNCLYAAWAVPLKAAGASYKVKPTLIVHNYSKVNTYCGVVSGSQSYYCGYKNGQIYIPAWYIINLWKQNPTYARTYATNTIAHEYGHHIQYLTGILNASWWRQRAFTTNSARLEESRRRELQASCLGSAYIGANKRYYPMSGGLYTQWLYLVDHSGDQAGYPRDHGSMANHGWWSKTGFYAASSKTYAGRCNTWSAASSRVA
jgi:uncharacterized protein